MVEQDTENVWVIGSSPILGDSFGFGEDRKRVALIIHAKGADYKLNVRIGSGQ